MNNDNNARKIAEKVQIQPQKNNNKTLVIVIVIVVLILLGGIFFFYNSKLFINGFGYDYKLKQEGKKFYEDFYYKQVGNSDTERVNKVKQYSQIGIKVDLRNLNNYKEGINEEDDTFEYMYDHCDIDNTKIIIYPEFPYGKEDYRIETELNCK